MTESQLLKLHEQIFLEKFDVDQFNKEIYIRSLYGVEFSSKRVIFSNNHGLNEGIEYSLEYTQRVSKREKMRGIFRIQFMEKNETIIISIKAHNNYATETIGIRKDKNPKDYSKLLNVLHEITKL